MSLLETIVHEISLVWLQIILVGGWLGLILGLAEALNRFSTVESEISRKVVHIGTGNVILLAWLLHIPSWVGIAASIIASIMAIISYQIPILPSINSVGRHSWGTLFYAMSVGILIGYFWSINQPYYAVLGILIMTWGDGMAAIIGQHFGRHPYEVWGMKKSWEGSGAMGIVSFLICGLMLMSLQGLIWQTWLVSVIVAIMAVILESFSKLGFDNLTVPIGTALIAFWFNQFLLNMG